MNRLLMVIVGFVICNLLHEPSIEAYIETCYDYNDCHADVDWNLGINVLYWKFYGADNLFSRSIPVYIVDIRGDKEKSEYLSIKYKTDHLFESSVPDYSLGFDLFLSKEIPEWCSCFRLSWTHFQIDQLLGNVDSYEGLEEEANKVDLLNEYFKNNSENLGKKKLRVDYDRINLRASRKFYTDNSSMFAGFMGLGVLFLEHERGNWAEIPENQFSSIINYKDISNIAVGLGELGLIGNVDLCPSSFYLAGEFGVITGVGSWDIKSDGDKFQIHGGNLRGPEAITIAKDTSVVCFTGIEYKFELGVKGSFCCLDWKFHAGYEGIYFFDLFRNVQPGPSGTFSIVTSGLGFAGPIVGITCCKTF
ncbi:MAG: hypothetical protein K940chlam7_00897 [Chlamydiae bacterium]|nr:hypothetical protein [Chlamydiota bacterium]